MTCIYFFVMVIIFLFITYMGRDAYVSHLSNEFVDACRTTGCINPEDYDIFMQKIAAAGDYQVTIIHRPKRFYVNEINGKKQLDSTYYYYENSDILKEMYPETGDNIPYKMKNGDRLNIEVRRGATHDMVSIVKSIFHVDISKYLVAAYGGMVGYSL